MVHHNDFVEHILELLEGIDTISTKRMFGGVGLFYDNLMFAIVVKDELYFKTDLELAEEYKGLGSYPSSYMRSGKSCNLNYYLAPYKTLDSADEMKFWAAKSIVVAQRASANKRGVKS